MRTSTFILLVPLALAPWGLAAGEVGYDMAVEAVQARTYTCVFSGQVTCHGKPCSGARVQVEVDPLGEAVVGQSVIADAQGQYRLNVQAVSEPQGIANWRLVAREADEATYAELEGHVILPETSVVLVERPILLARRRL